MGVCWSQQSIDNEAMIAGIDGSSAVERCAGEIIHANAGQTPAEGGSSEYVGAYMGNGIEQQNAVAPLMPVSNAQIEQPVPHVSLNAYQNSVEQAFDFPEENMITAVDQPIYQTIEEHPMVTRTVHNQIFEEQPAMLPVTENFVEETLPPVSPDIHYNYQEVNEPVVDVPYNYQEDKEPVVDTWVKEPVVDTPVETMPTPIVEEPLYPPFEANPMLEQTVHNQYIEEQPANEETVHSQICEEQPMQTLLSGDHEVLPTELSEAQAILEVNENYQVPETQATGNDLGVTFEGRVYSERVFDPNINEYVYVGGDDLQPRGGLLMWWTLQKSER